MSRSYDIQRICVLDYLSYIRNISETLKDIQSHIEQQEASLEMLGIGYSDLPKNPNTDTEKIPDGVIRLIELKEDWCAYYYDYSRDYESAKALCLPVFIERHLLWLHYVEGLTWRQVSRKVNYSQDYVQHLAKDGIRELYQLMPERFTNIPTAI